MTWREQTRTEPPGSWGKLDEVEHLRRVLDAVPIAMLMVDGQGRITLVNLSAEQLFGYARSELLGEAVELLVPGPLCEAHRRHRASFSARPEVRSMGVGRELHGRRKDGSDVLIEVGLNPIHTPGGTAVLASIIDISERRLGELARERLAALVESSEDAIISKSVEGLITSWNRGAEQLFGYAAHEILGQSIRVIVPDRCWEEERRGVARMAAGERVEPFDTRRRRKDGSEVDVSVRLSPIRNAKGAMVGISKIARDVTELRQRDAELQRSNAELEQFAYVASHDLQEPLRMVANYTELLAARYQGRLDERADRYIHYAADGARRMQKLVADLLTFSRVGSQGRALLPVSVSAAVNDVSVSLHQLMVETSTELDIGPLPCVMADEAQLRQLFQNLIGNAIKFRSEAQPRIVIRAERQGDRYELSVADNGIGLDEQYSARIFQMFQRLHERGRYDGSGIGLAIAKRIVERHGGTIWVTSTPGVGTTFSFTLLAAAGGRS